MLGHFILCNFFLPFWEGWAKTFMFLVLKPQQIISLENFRTRDNIYFAIFNLRLPPN